MDIRTSKKERHIPGRKEDLGNAGWAACWIEIGQCHQQEASRIRAEAAGLGVRGRDPPDSFEDSRAVRVKIEHTGAQGHHRALGSGKPAC